MNLALELDILRIENQELKAKNLLLENSLEEMSIKLTEISSQLEEALKKLNKNSSNSSKPPSSDFVRKTSSLRVTSNKKVGGQQGHLGSTLEKSLKVDDIIVHAVTCCSGCGNDLKGLPAKEIDSHQVFDLPKITIQVTEHRAEIKCCPNCGKQTKALFPEEALQPTQYGSNVKSLACYLSNYQLLPYKRCSQLIKDLFGHNISVSSLAKFNNELSFLLNPFEESIKEALLFCVLIHFDETGFYFKDKRNWLHVACNEFITYYFTHQKRGREAMIEMGILNNYKNKALHDFWSSYMDEDFDCEHYLCNVHHLRDLKFCYENEKSIWANKMSDLLMKMKKSVEDTIANELKNISEIELQDFLSQYEELLEEGKIEHPLPNKEEGKRGKVKKTKSRNLLERFEKHKESILGFLKDFQIPFGNNLAEQAIRMTKVKQKISGCFRSELGAENFAKIRSYIETMRKNDIDIMDAINLAMKGKPIMPF